MKFGGFSDESVRRVMARALREQPVFDEDKRVIPWRNETVLHLAGRKTALRPTSILDHYKYALSDSKKNIALAFVGIERTSYQINSDRLNRQVEDSKSRLESDIMVEIVTWHDVVVLSVVMEVTLGQGPLGTWAWKQIQALIAIDPDFVEESNRLIRRS